MLRFPTRAPSTPAFLGMATLIAASFLPLPALASGFTFTPYPAPRPVPLAKVTFENAQGKLMNLADFKGKVVLLNIWATWCPPCVEEMPTLNKLQTLLGGKEFAVVPLSIDKGGIFTVKSFYQDNFIDHLPIYVDATTHALDTLDILGTPTTILIDKQGREVARTLGPQDWDKPDVIAQIKRYMAMPGPAPSKPGAQARAGTLVHTVAEVTTPTAPAAALR
ncbi:TlpA disulfide reductase family protein [Thiomonas sp. FB-Cd]|uniref:TlpA family protein disulfide reductase n=1 Tax=Thiomonas sp. FB-Cd TaxID=1158292 RepID=UPI0009DDE562|nr:TlpA disulfide reductase family protein [Thiomonas sp. FB-Cd]